MNGTEGKEEPDLEFEALLREVGAREQPNPEMTAGVRETVHEEWVHVVSERRRVRRRHTALAIAASVVLTAGILFFAVPRPSVESPIVAHVDRIVGSGAIVVSHGSAKELQANAAIRADEALRTSINTRTALQLAPNLEIRIDQESEVKFAAADRIVLSRGAVYVDASGPNTPPLVIETSFGKIQHVGTQYESRLDGGALRVRVRTGEVKLVSDSGTTIAQAGEQLRVSISGVSREPVAISGPEWQWLARVAAVFDIENRSLAEFLVWASRETGYEVVYASDHARDAAHQVILHGSVNGLAPDSALTAVLSTTRFTYTQSANRIIVALAKE
jgi:ferric-dicitrate binding protein FerR (iron transport regulator)